MSTIDFELRILGVALCFYRNSYWNVIFPCDYYHQARLCFGEQTLALREEGKLNSIDFPRDRIEERSNLDEPDPNLRLFNMSADYAHGTYPDGDGGVLSNLRLYELRDRHPDTGELYDFVWLRLPFATRSVETPALCDYYVQDISGAIGLPPAIVDHPVAREVVFRFTATDEISFEAVDLRTETPSDTVKVQFPSSSTSYALEIDNDCHDDCPKQNDFLHLYRIVHHVNPNKPNERLKFAAGQLKCKKTTDLKAQERKTNCLDSKSSTYGNCDPPESNPPPQGP